MNSIENIAEMAQKSNPEEFKQLIHKLSPDQIIITVQALKDQHSNIAFQKIMACLEKLDEPKHLEALGSQLSLSQMLQILDAMQGHLPHWKLAPILVGTPSSLFSQLIYTASLSELNILKQEVFTEALQHHLTLMTHEIVQQIPDLSMQMDSLEQEIAQLNLDNITSAQIASLTYRIEQTAKNFQSALEKINKLQLLIWNTDRADLIEKLSTSKEIAQKIIFSKVGYPKTYSMASTGLFAYLEVKLSQVFEGFKTQQNIETLEDDEPAIEALVKFSLWYLRDYWEIGLLPRIKHPTDLDQQSPELSKDHPNSRENLYHEVNANLAKIQLKTVGDLKQHKIFSKATLVEYINQHKHLL